jgi:hypothetical protein
MHAADVTTPLLILHGASDMRGDSFTARETLLVITGAAVALLLMTADTGFFLARL